MKRIFSLILCLILAAGFAGPQPAAAAEEAPLRIVTTIFPLFDWTRELLGDRAESTELTMLLDSGVDLHSYQPTVDDIVKISACDLFIYVGGESDAWAEDVLREAANPDLRVLDLMDVLGGAVKEEETVEGMEDEDEEGDPGETEYDEHIWLSLRNARVCCAAIAQALAELDPGQAALYQENAAVYDEKLAALDETFAAALESADYDTLLFGDRFPFRYLTDDYQLKYYAAFSGCSAETEASFETIAFLAAKADELHLPAILTIEGTDRRIAQTIAENTNAPDRRILTLNSLQSVTAAEVRAGVTYLGILEDDLAVLVQALND